MHSFHADFPIFETYPNLVYLDSAAATQKPAPVLQAVHRFYTHFNANVHRGLYPLSQESTRQYESARKRIAEFIGAGSAAEVIFTKGATEALNLLAYSLTVNLQAGDEIILSELEHHANIVPWQQAARRLNLVVRYAKMTDGGEIDLENFRSLLSPATKIVSLSHCSNVFGRFIALSEIKKIMDEQGSAACLIADAAQSLPHLFPSVRDLGADFLVFSGHKVYGPSGIGVLWGREERLQTLPPYQTGGDMIRTVTLTGASWNALPWKFEAGTPNMEGAIGLAAALDYLVDQGTAAITDYTSHLSQTVRHSLEQIPSVRILGDPHPHSGIISFTVDGVHPHDLADLLGQKEICIRAGHHCAAPLHQQLGIPASNRISLGMYNTEADIDRFIAVLKSIITDFSHV